MIVKMSRVTFLLFDAYGTLVELDNFYERLQRSFAQNAAFEIPLDAMRRAAHREMRHYIKHSLRANRRDECELLRTECAQVLADALREENLQYDFSPAISYRVLDASIVFRAYQETRETLLQLLERGFSMGVLSNWDGRLPQVLRDLELDGFFDFVVSSAQVGYEKPDARFFEFGLQKIRISHPQIETENCIYIGDHWGKDVVPSRLMGMQAIWVVRNQRDFTSGETATNDENVPQVSNLRDLIPLLDFSTTDKSAQRAPDEHRFELRIQN